MLLQITEPGESQNNEETSAVVGIDLGTTNSLVAITNDGMHEVIEGEQGEALLPSVVAYLSGSVEVGSNALKNKNHISSVKRLMGRGLEDIKTLGSAYPYKLMQEKFQGMVALDVEGKAITPVEISAEILKALKLRAENTLDNKVEKAVITVPAYFDDAARQATKDAAKLAGLEVLRLVNEPTAAALAYGLDNNSEGLYAVYDLGGGTFDISILKMEKGVFQVLATGGNAALGGDDFDHALAEYLLKKAGVDGDINSENAAEILQISRRIKEELTFNNIVKISSLNGLNKSNFYNIFSELSIAKDEFEELVKPLVMETIKAFQQVLIDADIELEALKNIVMVGGSTRVPLVKEMVEEFSGKKALDDVDPDKVVVIGAALQAEALTKGNGTLLLDVTPLSLGLETMGGLMEIIIGRNSPIPCSATEKFTTYQDGQTGLKIHVLQGEREMVDKCRSLAKFELKGIPPMKAGAAVIEITFTLDADGVLAVSASEETTNIKQTIEVKPSYGIKPEDMERMLLESMEHAEEDIIERMLAESKVEAEQAIKAVEDAIKADGDLLGDDLHQKIIRQISEINKAIEVDDRDLIDYSVNNLNELCVPFAESRINRSIGEVIKGSDIEDISSKLA